MSIAELICCATIKLHLFCRRLMCNLEVADCSHRIEKQLELNASVSRVWRALTDRELGEWFRVKLDGPFMPAQISPGHITCPGYVHGQGEATVQKMDPERLFPSPGPSQITPRCRPFAQS